MLKHVETLYINNGINHLSTGAGVHKSMILHDSSTPQSHHYFKEMIEYSTIIPCSHMFMKFPYNYSINLSTICFHTMGYDYPHFPR
jgi:hypothetical protein